MIRAIHISDARKRDAQVAFDARYEASALRRVLPSGEEPRTVRLVKTTADIERRLAAYGSAAELAAAIADTDPDLDMEVTGRRLRRTRRLFVDADYRIVYRVNLFQVVRNPDGTQRERRELSKVPGNVNARMPLRWTGRLYPRAEAVRRFVFSRNYQLRHVNGATFDFLYRMARELDEADSMVMLGAGRRGTDPILLSRGGQPYRGLLEGRIDGERYCLILHLTDIELKLPDDDHL